MPAATMPKQKNLASRFSRNSLSSAGARPKMRIAATASAAQNTQRGRSPSPDSGNGIRRRRPAAERVVPGAAASAGRAPAGVGPVVAGAMLAVSVMPGSWS